MSNPRDHGLGNDFKVVGAPRVLHKAPGKCPNCGCASLSMIEIDTLNPALKGGRGRGVYSGCPACPWASPCLQFAHNPKGD